MPDKLKWKDILWAVQTPPDVCGWMDWVTGVLYLNEVIENPAAWKTILAGWPTDPSMDMLQTITHENVHFLQMATTGYMYRWGCQLYGKLVTAMKPLLPEIHAYLDNPAPSTLLSIESRVLASERAELKAHLAKLDLAGGPNDVTVRDLLESHAYLVEKKSHWEHLDAAGYLHMLNEQAPSPEYRHAYDLARFRLGDGAAFAFFPLIASLSLCAENPPHAFDILVAELGKSSWPQSPSKTDFEHVQKIADETTPERLGSSADVYDLHGLTHPVYTDAIHAINEACHQGLKLLDFFTDPPGHLEPIVNDVLQPMVFGANSKDQFSVFVPPKSDQAKVTSLLLYSVLASRVLGPQWVEDRSERSAAYGWVAQVRPDLLNLVVEPEQLRQGDLRVLAQLDPTKLPEHARKDVCSLWGRCLVTFDVEDGSPLWTRPEVRRFIVKLEQSNPAFPVYLSMDSAFGMFIVWFGSLADPTACAGQALNLMHESVLEHLIHSIRAIGKMADKLSFQPRPVIQDLLAHYPPEFAEKLLREAALPNSH